MAREIELKARVTNPDEIRQKLSRFAVWNCAFEKEDSYWRGADKEEQHADFPPYGVRVRKETAVTAGETRQTVYVTWKLKEVRSGIEFNNEKEFIVSEAPVFEDFLAGLGFLRAGSKRKKGGSWRRDTMTVELTEVERLGWFIEMEILLPDEENKVTSTAPAAPEDRARDTLLAALDIPREAVESRSYAQLLSELSRVR